MADSLPRPLCRRRDDLPMALLVILQCLLAEWSSLCRKHTGVGVEVNLVVNFAISLDIVEE